tara:strand:+ start:691 stop:1272 length:582 start_codon:yes stop_codon:yes gene_type:complete
MAIRLTLRNPDGTFTRGSLKNAEKQFTKFGSNVIEGGRKILNQKKKRNKGTLFNDFHYTLDVKRTSMQMGFRFGGAEKYWDFVDEGVRGFGGFKGRGRARGQGSPYKFNYANPGGALVQALKRGYGLSTSRSFAAGYNIKRRGLERTQFYSKPIKEQVKKLPDELLSGFAKDIDKLIKDIPERMVVVTNEMSL